MDDEEDHTDVPAMNNLKFGFYDDAAPKNSRILMFYSFDIEGRLPQSGLLHYHVAERRFVGPRQDRALTSAALEFLSRSGRLPEQA